MLDGPSFAPGGSDVRPQWSSAGVVAAKERERRERRSTFMNQEERGKPGGFDPKSGDVHGSGSGAGGGGNPDEDYDDDAAAGSGQEPIAPAGRSEERGQTNEGHPLPASDEARHKEIPENIERRKGVGDDNKAALQPDAVNPDGTHYPRGEG